MEDKIIMSVGDRLIELTPDEAKQLREKLNAMFGQPLVPRPFPVPGVPWEPPHHPWPMQPPHREWWADGTNCPPPPTARVDVASLSTDGFTW